MQNLPIEILYKILLFLPLKSILNCTLLSKSFHQIIQDPFFWKLLTLRDCTYLKDEYSEVYKKYHAVPYKIYMTMVLKQCTHQAKNGFRCPKRVMISGFYKKNIDRCFSHHFKHDEQDYYVDLVNTKPTIKQLKKGLILNPGTLQLFGLGKERGKEKERGKFKKLNDE